MTGKIERRKHPRIKDNNISVKLSSEGSNAITQSVDISASGIYCKVTERIPVMTRVQIVLSIPGKTKSAASKTLNLDGIIVRENAAKKDGKIEHYDIAIFFNTLMPKEKKVLVEYIANRTS